MPAVVVDTDVVSFTLKGDSRAKLYRRHLVGRTLLISFMTLAELYAWARIRRWGPKKRAELARQLGRYVVMYADATLCERWAAIMHEARAQGRAFGVADGWVAATALVQGVPLVTHNAKHFAGVGGLRVLTVPPRQGRMP